MTDAESSAPSPASATNGEKDPLLAPIADLVRLAGGDPATFSGSLVAQLLRTSLRLLRDQADTGQMKLMAAALREMRYAYRVFNRYRGLRKISIFGSARTPPDHPDYDAARRFSRLMAQADWMAITGAGDGIMKAGHEGPQREKSFGLSIRLPFETTANEVIEGDPKLINFRYFFTRKLMFMSHSDAVAVFPGGFGTQDELFEALTLIQTGKSNPIPVVLVEGTGGTYWAEWLDYIQQHLLRNGWISPEDQNLYHVGSSVEDAVQHVLRFYRRYHSSRYVRDVLVIRMTSRLTTAALEQLNREFADIVASGTIAQVGALPEENDHPELPRLCFHHTRRAHGRIRALIDRVNSHPIAD
ncbi:MAG: LOG family protein [Phycisphaerales bacterium]|nr:LOG family protein [Phycisphaerales bacterium]